MATWRLSHPAPDIFPLKALAQMVAQRGPMTRSDRILIVEQALTLLEMTYVHLPQKRAMYAIDALQRLRLLKYQLEQSPDLSTNLESADELAFHNEMTDIFTSLRDLHTNYLLPSPYNQVVAFLPFLVEEYVEQITDRGGKVHYIKHYIVGKLTENFTYPASFVEGVEILYWNGVPIQRAIELVAELQAGGNVDARFARGLAALTFRPLARMRPPDEEWVTITYRTEQGKRLEMRGEWLALDLVASSELNDAQENGESLAFGFDIQGDDIQQTRARLFAPAAQAEKMAIRSGVRPRARRAGPLETEMPTVFRVREQETTHGKVGYVRIYTFMVANAFEFVNEFQRLITRLPARGLILDVRGNGGGNIWAAEGILRLLTDKPVEAERFQFINSPLTLKLCRRYDDLAPWASSIEQAVRLGTIHSLGFPITPSEFLQSIQQAYFGPVVLITDALCYSATDIFAAGFQDHEIGKVIDVNGTTGAGGANVWTHQDLRLLFERVPPGRAGNPFRTLPLGSAMRVAIRRSLRVGKNAGIPLEDLGVVADHIHPMSLSDVLHDNIDLLEIAAAMLVKE